MTADAEEAFRRLCADAATDIDALILGLGEGLEPVVIEGLRTSLLAVFDGIARRALPSPDDLSRQRDWGRQPGALNLFHDAARQAWVDLSRRARAAGVAGELISRANLYWAWIQNLSTAATADSASAVEAADRLVDALFAGRVDGEIPAGLARRLGFDPDGEFQVICCRPAAEPEQVRFHRGPVVASVRGELVVVVFQRVRAEEILVALGSPYRQSVGLGLIRRGLRGAAESLTDAEAALRLSLARGRPVSFEDEWMPIILMLDADRLRPLVAASVGAPAHLEQAVVLWAYSDFSIPVAARKLHIHPNTLKYRLDRWREVTGWDPRARPDLELTLLHHNLNTVLGSDSLGSGS